MTAAIINYEENERVARLFPRLPNRAEETKAGLFPRLPKIYPLRFASNGRFVSGVARKTKAAAVASNAALVFLSATPAENSTRASARPMVNFSIRMQFSTNASQYIKKISAVENDCAEETKAELYPRRLLTEAGKSAALFMLLLLFCVIEHHHFATSVIICAAVAAVRIIVVSVEGFLNQQQKTLQREP